MPTAPPRTRCSSEKHAFGKLSLESSSKHHSLPSEKEAWSRAALGVRALSLRARECARQVEAEAQCQPFPQTQWRRPSLCRLGPPPRGRVVAARASGPAAGFRESGTLEAWAGTRARQQGPEYTATTCSGENEVRGKTSAEREAQRRVDACRFMRTERPGCGARLSLGSAPTRR